MVVAFDHQTAYCIPNHVVMHGAVLPCSYLTNRSIKSNTVLDDIVNPVVRNFSAGCLPLHDLNHRTIGLQMTNIPYFVVEDLGRITDGQH